MVSQVLFSSNSDEWGTPQVFFNNMNVIFNFTLDAAASKENHKCQRYFTEDMNSLKLKWNSNSVWCNPPYSKCKEFSAKALFQLEKGNCETIAFLVPSRTETLYWQSYMKKCTAILFIKGRLKFNDGKGAAPFPSALCLWGLVTPEQILELKKYGHVMIPA